VEQKNRQHYRAPTWRSRTWPQSRACEAIRLLHRRNRRQRQLGRDY